MQFHWGYKIFAVYIIFVSGIVWMVYRSGMEKVDLVTPDYYEQEIRFQERIDQKHQAEKLSAPVQVVLKNNIVYIELPIEFMDREVSGDIKLYCPSDVSKDLHAEFRSSDRRAGIRVPNDRSGYFVLQLSFYADGKGYYVEKELFIP